MMRKMRTGGIAVAMVAAIALFGSACGGNGGSAPAADQPTEAATPTETPTEAAPATPTGDKVEITWWHNGTGEPLFSFWNTVAQEFMDKNPGVTVNVEAFQNEELRDTILPSAFVGGNAPDLFQSWGGGELVAYVDEGIVMDLSPHLSQATKDAVGAAAYAYEVGNGIYGLPYALLPSGFWVNTDLWHEAGLDAYPTTMDELFADWQTLKEHNITPVAVGGGSGWPAAHWYYWTALRSVPTDALQAGIVDHNFSDPNWDAAGENLQKIMDQDAFNPGWQATDAQTGAQSASGLVVMGQAAMQLMGTWDAGVMGGIYNEAQGLPEDTLPPAFLDWFPFPEIPGANGDQRAIMGGFDGFSVHANAPVETVALLEYIVSDDVQTRYAAMGNIPANRNADSAVEMPALQKAAAALNDASRVQLWLDTAFGPTVATPMNDAIIAFMSGQGTPGAVVDAIRNAAAG